METEDGKGLTGRVMEELRKEMIPEMRRQLMPSWKERDGDVETQKEDVLLEKDNKLDGIKITEVEIVECAGDANKQDTHLQIVHMEMVEGDKGLLAFIVENLPTEMKCTGSHQRMLQQDQTIG